MVSSILGHCTLLYSLLSKTIVTTIIITMIDKNAYGFNKYYFGIRSGFKKITQFF